MIEPREATMEQLTITQQLMKTTARREHGPTSGPHSPLKWTRRAPGTPDRSTRLEPMLCVPPFPAPTSQRPPLPQLSSRIVFAQKQ